MYSHRALRPVYSDTSQLDVNFTYASRNLTTVCMVLRRDVALMCRIPSPNGSSSFEVSAIFGMIILMTFVSALKTALYARNFMGRLESVVWLVRSFGSVPTHRGKCWKVMKFFKINFLCRPWKVREISLVLKSPGN